MKPNNYFNTVYKILKSNHGTLGGLIKSAKEITKISYPKELVEWVGYSYGFNDLSYREIHNDWIFINKPYTLDELFEFWEREVKK